MTAVLQPLMVDVICPPSPSASLMTEAFMACSGLESPAWPSSLPEAGRREISFGILFVSLSSMRSDFGRQRRANGCLQHCELSTRESFCGAGSRARLEQAGFLLSIYGDVGQLCSLGRFDWFDFLSGFRIPFQCQNLRF
jgi:hypothetical protein